MVFHFKEFELDTHALTFHHAGRQVFARPKVFDLLSYLIEHRNRVVTKTELVERVWANQAITDSTLATSMRDVRKVVGDTGADQSVIRTVCRRGYQFVAETDCLDGQRTTPASVSGKTDFRTMMRSERLSARARRGQILAESSTVSALACGLSGVDGPDWEGSTEQLLWPSARFEHVARRVLATFGGTVLRVFDYGIVAAFGLPHAQDDHFFRAMISALTLREMVNDLDETGGSGAGEISIDFRAGLCADQQAHDPDVAPDESFLSVEISDVLTRAEDLWLEAPPGRIRVDIAKAVLW